MFFYKISRHIVIFIKILCRFISISSIFLSFKKPLNNAIIILISMSWEDFLMHIEKLDENQIRIFLDVFDLKEKNIDLHTFMSNPLEARQFNK